MERDPVSEYLPAWKILKNTLPSCFAYGHVDFDTDYVSYLQNHKAQLIRR